MYALAGEASALRPVQPIPARPEEGSEGERGIFKLALRSKDEPRESGSRPGGRKKRSCALVYLASLLLLALPTSAKHPAYRWLAHYDAGESIVRRIAVPGGYERVAVSPGTFGEWLRNLPLKKGRPPVCLYDGTRKANQEAHFAVVDIDVGTRDLQQCADAVIRLRAEYLYSVGRYEAIHFDFTNGTSAEFARWVAGYRPIVGAGKVAWAKSAREDASYRSFRSYLDLVFTYAGTLSLSRELERVAIEEMRIGDVLIQGGQPGHAVIIVDMAVQPGTGQKIFLAAQSYMPAQDLHILRNPLAIEADPWYETSGVEELCTPEWTFRRDDLKRFR